MKKRSGPNIPAAPLLIDVTIASDMFILAVKSPNHDSISKSKTAPAASTTSSTDSLPEAQRLPAEHQSRFIGMFGLPLSHSPESEIITDHKMIRWIDLLKV